MPHGVVPPEVARESRLEHVPVELAAPRHAEEVQHGRCDVALADGAEVAHDHRPSREHQQPRADGGAGAGEAAGVGDEHEHVVLAPRGGGLAEEPVHETVLLAHGGELRVERGEIARRRLPELLHREDVEAGEVDGLEVGRSRSRAGPPRPRGGSGRCAARARSSAPAASARSFSKASGGWTSRSGAPPFSSLKRARSVTSQPFTGSAGQVAHQFTTPTRRPFSEATFQNAFTLRSAALGGCLRVSRSRSVAAPRAEANGLRSPSRPTGVRRPATRRDSGDRMPWASGPRPVAIVVHTMAGTRSGSARSAA